MNETDLRLLQALAEVKEVDHKTPFHFVAPKKCKWSSPFGKKSNLYLRNKTPLHFCKAKGMIVLTQEIKLGRRQNLFTFCGTEKM